MGKYDNLLKEDVFKVFGEENVNKVIEFVTDKGKQREEFIEKLKTHDKKTIAVLVLCLLKNKIITDKSLKEYYHNEIGNEIRTGKYMPCC